MMNEDMILEIMSHCPATEIAKFRLLNKECNKRSYEYNFLNRHMEKTSSVFGYFINYPDSFDRFIYPSRFVSGTQEKEEEATNISLDFLPSTTYVKIEACDTHHGILLCVEENRYRGGSRVPAYIVCKPATKQYRIISNPKTRFFTIATGLMVIQSNPFRYKIVRVSQPLVRDRRKTKEGFSNYNCEVFDSHSSSTKWKRLKDLELVWCEFLRQPYKPVSVYGFLHWLTTKNNVIRFCMRTETWSNFSVPDNVVGRELVSYEGKLGVIGSRSKDGGDDLWVLEKSFGTSWTIVKDVKTTGLDDKYELLWFPSSDVVSTAGYHKLGLYNMNSNNIRYMQKDIDPFSAYHCSARDYCFPFYSNYDRVDLNGDRIRRSDGERKDPKEEIKRRYVITKCLI